MPGIVSALWGLASPYKHIRPKKRTYAITGILDGVGPDGSRPLRYEFNKFIDVNHNPYAKDQLPLFLLALSKMQEAPRTEKLSWFQICGIHGEPYLPWDGPEETDDVDETNEGKWRGYCTHASILFTTWHRVYLLLTEQVIQRYMKEISNDFPQVRQASLKQAIDHWRLPYWDWALRNNEETERLSVPRLFRIPQIEIDGPRGRTIIDNPLYRYRFPTNEDGKVDGISDIVEYNGEILPMSKVPFTLRWPPAYDCSRPLSDQREWAEGISDNKSVEEALNHGMAFKGNWREGGKTLVSDVYRLLATQRSYPAFSNTGWRPQGGVNRSPADYLSLEGIHNSVHVFVGGLAYGHMSENEVAAFDPIFWMHHGNIDRIFAIFQALNPADYKSWPDDPWISGTKEPWFKGQHNFESYTMLEGVLELPTSPLAPFHKDEYGECWDSNSCRDIQELGYAFEELRDWLPKYHASGKFDKPAYCEDIRKSLNDKYSWANSTLRRLRGTKPEYNEYILNVRVDRFALGGRTFIVSFYLEDADTPEKSLGDVSIFGGRQFLRGKCGNCYRQALQDESRTVVGQVSITNALLVIEDGNPKHDGDDVFKLADQGRVYSFLLGRLRWRIIAAGNEEIGVGQVPSLDVTLAFCKATGSSTGSELVRYSEFESLGAFH